MKLQASPFARWTLFAGLLLVSVLMVLSLQPPAPLPFEAPVTEFSAERAFEHVRRIAQEPHPVGSPANAAVRDYLLSQLESSGLETQVQRAVGVNREIRSFASVENVLARLPGTGGPGGEAVLLVGHYDSVPSGPGAADNGAAVAALLETARALKAGERLQNDVIFLFSDAEELKLLGAEAFARHHSWMQSAGVVLNFEARGNRGPAYMFETTSGNSPLIAGLAQAAPYPLANSLMYEVYRNLPNDTDFSVFKQAGLPGLNFSFIDGAAFYHSPLDNPENLDLGSLQHHGSYALSLTRYFGNQDLDNLEGGNAVYFNFIGSMLIHYPAAWAVPLSVLAILGYMGVFILARRKEQFKGLKVVWAALLALLGVLLAGALGWLGWMLITNLFPDYTLLGATYNSDIYWIGFMSLAATVSLALTTTFRNRLGVFELALGAQFWWVVLALVTALLAPGVSYLLLWPLVFALIGTAGLLTFAERWSAWGQAGWMLLALAPGLVLGLPTIYAVNVGLTIQAVFIPMILLTLFLSLVVPYFAAPRRWGLAALTALAAVGFFVAGGLTSHFDPQHPKINTVVYGLDAQRDQAYWVGFAAPDEWTAQFLVPYETRPVQEFFPYSSDQLPVSVAPELDLPAPQAELLEDYEQDGIHYLRIHLNSSRDARVLHVYTLTWTRDVLAAEISGIRVEGMYAFDYAALPSDGIEVLFELQPGTPFMLRLVDVSDGLPEIPGFDYQPRPEDQMRAPVSPSDSVLVSADYEF